MNKEEILKEFDEKFPEIKEAKEDIDDEYNGEIEKFLSQALDQYLQAYKDELVKEIGKLYLPEDGSYTTATEVAIRADEYNRIIKIINNPS